MQRFKTILDTIIKLKELILALSAVTLWILALWTSYKLSPIVEDIEHLDYRISANENSIDSIGDDIIIIKEDVGFIKGWVNAQ